MSKKKLLVIGFGSVLRGDDSFGPMVAEEIKSHIENKFWDISDIQILIRQTLTPELALDISKHDLVIFIDASTEGTPGEYREEHIYADSADSISMVHFLTPKAILNWTLQLYDKKVDAIMLTVQGQDFNFGIRKLTSELESLRPIVVERTREIIYEHLA
jgi:hydrogenase maturation protease